MTMPDKVQFLCSCPDYLNGTTSGKLTKKKTTCKQCKGIKLPFTAIGGTVRMFSTPYVFDPIVTKQRNCVGTVRLPSSATSATSSTFTAYRRPTILCGDHDPYDFLRQSRLLYSGNDQRKSMPEASNDASHRFFRNATAATAANGDATSTNGPPIMLRTAHRNFHPCATVGRASAASMFNAMVAPPFNRSILQTNINPYELISAPINNNEFAPTNTNLYDLVAPRKVSTSTQVVSVPIDLAIPTRKAPPISASATLKQRTLPSRKISMTPTMASPSTTSTATNSKSDSSNVTQTLTSPSKYKSILKQSIVGTNASRNVDSLDVLRDVDSNMFEQQPTNEMPNSQLNRIPVPVRSVSISNGGVGGGGGRSVTVRPSSVPMSTYDAHTIGRSKKVQFSESRNENEKSIDDHCADETDDRHNRAKSPAAPTTKSTSDADTKPKATNEAEFTRSRRRKSINRSMSDRRVPDTKEDLKFKDTMALRAKPIRKSPQQLFQKHLSPLRPVDPPPKLPASATTKVKVQPPPIPVRPPRQQRKGVPPKSVEDPPASRIFGLLPVSTIAGKKGTTIKIPAFGSSAVANGKTQVKDGKCDETRLLKTSIAINGNDTGASTVSVNDNVQLYHSSVLIGNNANPSMSPPPSSDVKDNASDLVIKTIKDSAIEGPATEISIVYHSNGSSTKTGEVSQTISTNANKTKTLICLDYKDQPEHTVRSPTPNGCANERLSPRSFNGAPGTANKAFADSFILKLLNDPDLGHLLQGLEIKTIATIIENALLRIKANRTDANGSTTRTTKDTVEADAQFMNLLHNIIKEERKRVEQRPKRDYAPKYRAKSPLSPYRLSAHKWDDRNDTIPVRQLYEMLVDSSLWKSDDSNHSSEHQYESICLNCDPIYEEINDQPPPLPLNPPPSADEMKSNKNYKSMFLGASKYDILSYLVDAKERGIVPDETYTFKFLRKPIDESMRKSLEDPSKITIIRDRNSDGSSKLNYSSSSDDMPIKMGAMNGGNSISNGQRCMASIERNDSGVGSETSKTSRNKYLQPVLGSAEHKTQPIHLCEDCDEPIELQLLDSTTATALVCQKCAKKRAERREILAEFFETEEKYSRDLQIIIDEFYQPMLVAGLLTQEQLSAVFLNIEDLLENSQAFCEKIRDAFFTALEQGDDDLFTVDIGRIILNTTVMLSAFETYCVQQAAASLLLANLEKDKELLRIFLRVSQMENAVLRRMNLNSFLMVPVQRVTKYPLLLARLYKVTPTHLECRERLKDAKEMIESHLNRMNREAKDISTKLWRRLSSNPTMRPSRESDIVNIKLRKIAIDLLEWNHEKVHFIAEGKLLLTQPTDNNWRKGRTIKLTPVNAFLITNEMGNSDDINVNGGNQLNFTKPSSSKEAVLLLVREKSSRYSLYREPFYLDRCVVCTESEWAEYFEVHEIASKDSFIFKAEDDSRTKNWYSQLQYHAQGTGAWRKRRTALANIMINGMMLRS